MGVSMKISLIFRLILRGACLKPQQVLLHLQIPYILHCQFFPVLQRSHKCAGVCTCLCDRVWIKSNQCTPLSFILYWSSEPSNIGHQTHFCCSSKWTSVSYFAHHGFQQVPLIIFKVRMEVFVFILHSEIILSFTARPQKVRVSWTISELTWIKTRGTY